MKPNFEYNINIVEVNSIMKIEEHIDNWAEQVDEEYRHEHSDLVCEMANKYREETLLPMNIWIDETKSYISGRHGKRVKFQLDKAEDFENGNTGEMDLNGNIFPSTLRIRKLKSRDLTALRNFIHNNKYALDHIADQDLRLYKIWPHMIMGGEVASEQEIKDLNALVDKFIAEKKARA